MKVITSYWSAIIGKDSEWFWAMLQFLVITVTLILIYLQVRLQTASHVVNTLTTINTRWNSEAMLRARYIYCHSWQAGKRDFDSIAEYVAEFLEELGNYIELGAIPKDVMWAAHSWYIEHYYFMFKSGLEYIRRKHNDTTLYLNFESLFVCMIGISRSKGAPHEKNEKELMAFAEDEIEIAKAFLKLREDDEIYRRS